MSYRNSGSNYSRSNNRNTRYPGPPYGRPGGRRRGRRNFTGIALVAGILIVGAIIGISLAANKGGTHGGGGTASPALLQTETPSTTATESTATQPMESALTETAAPTQQETAPADEQASEFFTNGDVKVDMAAMEYKSVDLYVKVTNVNENGVNYYVADCRATDSSRLFTALATDQYPVQKEEVATVMAKRKGAVIAINGDYFGSSAADRANRGIAIRNGKVYRKAPWYDIAAIFTDGTMKTYDKSSITADELVASNCWQAWSLGPMLMDGNGKALPESQIKARPPKYNPANPRTGIGYIEPNHFVLVVVDGVRNGINAGFSKGLSTSDFAKLFESLGCKCAYNLDGGGSSVMVFMGKVISHPCDLGPDNQRAMSDIVYFGESETDQANIDRISNQ